MGKMYSLEEQLSVLTPEQLEALKQEMIKIRDAEIEKENKGKVRGLVGKGILRGLAAFGEGAVLGLQNRPISEGSFMRERPASMTEMDDLDTNQAIVDESGNIIGYRPKGAVFKPKESKEKESAVIEETIRAAIANGEELTPEQINYYNKFMWRTGAEMKLPKIKKDKFGFTLGQMHKGYKYIGNNQWQKQ